MRLFAIVFALLLPVVAQAGADKADLETLREGSMKKLVFSETPIETSDIEFSDLADGTHSLADSRGRYVLVNFWATWCAPCRAEMSALDQLQANMGGDSFAVVTIATGHNSPTAMRRFFDEQQIANLPLFTDPKQKLARDMGVLGLPTSVLIDPEGREIARLRGDAEWNGDSARAIIGALVADQASFATSQ